ncbi:MULTISPECIES: hypothetical protein [Bacillaceae]|nr:hypothetical protein [Bacillus sp. Au-Bac7]MCE4048768.1 hypothetical protein [Bacillus sp. Au-Bac7]
MSVENRLIQGESEFFYEPFYIPYFLVALGLFIYTDCFYQFRKSEV